MKYIGLDAHSNRSFFVVLDRNGKVLTRQCVKTHESEIVRFIRSVKGKKSLTFEEGVLSQWLYLLTKDEVEQLVVCQPSKRNGPKTDWIDAFENADLLRVKRLKSVFHADDELFNIRTLISGYDDLVGDLTRAKNRYKALYRQVAVDTKSLKIFQDCKMIQLLPTETQRYVAGMLFENIMILERQKEAFVVQFEANAGRYKPIRLMMTIPCIGPVRANQIVGIIVTPYRFKTKYNLFSYSMLTKHDQRSDGKLYGRKRSNGQVVLKNVFRSSAISSLRTKSAFCRKYTEKRELGAKDYTARVAVSQKIAATVLGVWKSGKKYDDKKAEAKQQHCQNSRG